VHEGPLRGLPAVMVPLTMTTVVVLFDEANWDAGKEDGLSIGVKDALAHTPSSGAPCPKAQPQLGLEGSRAACNSGVLKERATEV
jgi:hypothetical protein